MASEIKTEPVCSAEDSEFSTGSLPTAGSLPKRVKLVDNLESLDKEALLNLWNAQDLYVDHVENTLKELLETKPVGCMFVLVYLTINSGTL